MHFRAEALAALAADAGLGQAGIELVALDGSMAATANPGPEVAFYPASMIKTPLAVAAALAVHDGRAAWNESLLVTAANMTVNDAPSPLVPGAAATIADLVDAMLARSDNVATNMLVDRLDRQRATRDLAALGFPETRVARKVSGALPLIDDPAATGRNAHPPHEARALFMRLARAELPGSDRILAALTRQYWNTKLSAGLAPGDRLAHKTGDTDDVSHDGGILTLASGEHYVLVVYTNVASNAVTDQRFAAFMRALRPLLGGTAPETR